MSMSTVLIISLAAGVILVVGGGLLMYMAQLVKNAYELKVQINSEVNERLTKMAEDLDKKSRWIKRDLLEEIEKIKIAMETSNAQKFAELTEPFGKRLEIMEETLRRDRAEWQKAVQEDRDAMQKLDARLGTVRREIKQQGDGAAPPDAATAPAAANGANGANGAGSPKGAAASATSPQAKPAIPDNTTMSGFLPDLGKKA
jgi:predicted phage gp36 major capsid-like protein